MLEPTGSSMKLSDQIQYSVAARLVRLPLPVIWALGARRPVVIDGNRLDPRVAFALALMERAGRPPLHRLPAPQARREYLGLKAVFEGEVPPLPYVEDSTIPGPEGDITVRIYKAGPQEPPPPIVVYFHGGGGVIGSLDTHDVVCRRLTLASRCTIVSVDYALAPEDPFPQGLADAIAAFRYVRDHADRFGGEPGSGSVAVGGDSMGGCLATVVAKTTLEDEAGPPCFQLLIYPLTDATAQTRSRRLFEHGFLLTGTMIRWFETTYLAGADPSDPRASPLLFDSLEGMPPALVVTAGFDPLRDEGQAYAQRLEQAGVQVSHHCYTEHVHGFAQMSGAIESARVALQDVGARLQRALQQSRRSRPESPAQSVS